MEKSKIHTKIEPVLIIKDLSVDIQVMRGKVPAVRGMDLDVQKGEILGLVGESGCGKTTSMLAIARLLPKNAAVKVARMNIDGIEAAHVTEKELLKIRGKKVAYIFQDPQASLNPVMKIREQIAEAILVHQPDKDAQSLEQELISLMEDVQIKQAQIWLDSYPHQLSGGMKQRVMIAIALANSPSILIADEPTTSLDVTVQSEILKLLKIINQKKGMSIIFITHDLAVAGKICDRIAVMYTGKIVEIGDVDIILRSPSHPYTRNLWNSIPRIDEDIQSLSVIPGSIPDKLNIPSGCSFHPRCEKVSEKCRQTEPGFTNKDKVLFACFHPYGPSAKDPS